MITRRELWWGELEWHYELEQLGRDSSDKEPLAHVNYWYGPLLEMSGRRRTMRVSDDMDMGAILYVKKLLDRTRLSPSWFCLNHSGWRQQAKRMTLVIWKAILDKAFIAKASMGRDLPVKKRILWRFHLMFGQHTFMSLYQDRRIAFYHRQDLLRISNR